MSWEDQKDDTSLLEGSPSDAPILVQVKTTEMPLSPPSMVSHQVAPTASW